jgi:3-dehydroquinate dehydratase-2
MSDKILVIHGPNMNILGVRDVNLYGAMTIEELNESIMECALNNGMEVMIEQSNGEGELIDIIHHRCIGDSSSPGKVQALIINPAAYSHYSYAIRDALEAVSIPVVEVHMTNVMARTEDFRQQLVTAPVCQGLISGFGPHSYLLAVQAVKNLLEK